MLPEVPVCTGEKEKCFLLHNVEINLSALLGRELSRMWSWIFQDGLMVLASARPASLPNPWLWEEGDFPGSLPAHRHRQARALPWP